MSSSVTAPETPVEVPLLPVELWGDLRTSNPNSHEFLANYQVLGELALSEGYRVPSLDEIFPPQEVIPPSGFTREIIVPGGATLSTDQFNGRIYSLAETGPSLTVDVHELTSDSGGKIAYCDLRDLMTSSVKGGGPTERGEGAALERAIALDFKHFAEFGRGRKTVKGINGVFYSAVNGTKIRGYWMLVTPETPLDMPLVGRIADCGNSVRSEGDLYRRVFNKSF